MITADRGPAVFGTHNTIVCARAGAGLGVGRGVAGRGGAGRQARGGAARRGPADTTSYPAASPWTGATTETSDEGR